MAQVVQYGQVNLAALNVPDLIVVIIPPQLLINGVPSNIVGFVGTASWGPVDQPIIVGGYASYVSQFGNPVARKYDMGSALWAATQQGAQAFRCVRATDGTDTAASVVIQTNCLTVDSLYSGSLGNTINFSIGNGSKLNTFRAVVAMGSSVPEVFDNISEGVVSFTVTAGTYTVCPDLITITPPTLPGGVQAVAYPQLVATGSGTIGGTMVGYVVNDTVTFPNGVQITVNTVTSGAIATFTITNPGSVSAGQTAPTSPMAQTSTTGTGTGATLTVATWGLGQPVSLQGGSGYHGTAPTATLVGGTGTGGTLVANVAYWPNVAAAINNGISGLRGPSQRVTATAGSGTSAPTVLGYALTGGTDGGNPSSIGQSGAPALVGVDSVPRTGMYAMRSSYISMGVLVDCDDASTWSTQVAFGESEGMYMIGTGVSGENINTATNTTTGPKFTFGIDSFTFKLMFGDWCYINDPITGVQRLISPQGFVAGFMGNQDPSQTPMNKPMNGIVGTQKSSTGIQYSNADLQALSTSGIDVICNPNPGGSYFGLRLGINTSSNLAVNGDNYTRMTYFIANTIARGCGSYVGELQTPSERQQAATSIAAFLANLEFLGLIGTADGSASYSVQINDANNPQTMVALGYQFATVMVTYLSVIRYFVVNLQGGQTVVVPTELVNGVPSSANTGALISG